MRKLLLALAASALISSPALAGVNCKAGQGVETTLEFETNEKGEPYLTLDPRIVGEICIPGKSTYRVKGISKTRDSMRDAVELFKALMLVGEVYTAEEMPLDIEVARRIAKKE